VAFQDETAIRRRALVAEVGRLAKGVGAALREARTYGLPVEPGTSEARDALIRWSALLEELVPPTHPRAGG
jgi:hypothetical protein